MRLSNFVNRLISELIVSILALNEMLFFFSNNFFVVVVKVYQITTIHNWLSSDQVYLNL